MAESTSTYQKTADEQSIIAFKQELNKLYPQLTSDNNNVAVLETADINDLAFQDRLAEFTQKLEAEGYKDYGDFSARFKAMPRDVQDKINASLTIPIQQSALPAQQQAEQPTPAATPATTSGAAASLDTPREQRQKEIVRRAEDVLGVDNTGSTDVELETARAMKERLKILRDQNPDMDSPGFIPQKINGNNTVDFLNALIKKQTEKNEGADAPNLAIQIDAMEQKGLGPTYDLGNLVALRDLGSYMNSGFLSSALSLAGKPDVAMPWAYNTGEQIEQEPDRFFPPGTYQAFIKVAKGDTNINDGKPFSGKLLSDGAHDVQLNRILEAAKNLGHVDENIDLGVKKDKLDAIDQLAKKNFSYQEIGQIAKEIMVIQAKELCIEKGDIANAIMEGRFNPNLENDMMLVEASYGTPKPPQEELEHLAARKSMFHDRHYAVDDLTAYDYMPHTEAERGRKFAEEFGTLKDENARPYANNYIGNLPYSKQESASVTEKWMERHQSPVSIFRTHASGKDGSMNPYNALRQKHLWNLKDRAVEGTESCDVKPDAAGDKSPATATDDDGLCYANDATTKCNLDEEETGAQTDGKKPKAFAEEVDPSTGEDTALCYANDQGPLNPCFKEKVEPPGSTAEAVQQAARDIKPANGMPDAITPVELDRSEEPVHHPGAI